MRISKKFFASLAEKSLFINNNAHLYTKGGEYMSMTEYIAKLMELEQLLLQGKKELEELTQILEKS